MSNFNFSSHRELEGRHAFLSASKYHWIRYDEARMEETYSKALSAMRGSMDHEFAAMAIKLRHKMPRTRKTLNQYVNDAIGFRMIPEQILVATPHAFGTADAISFRKQIDSERMLLRIHDLKTGSNKCKPEQLYVYAAFFCIEYGFLPVEIDMELRIYQNDAHEVYIPDPHEITQIMSTAIAFSKRLDAMREEALGD